MSTPLSSHSLIPDGCVLPGRGTSGAQPAGQQPRHLPVSPRGNRAAQRGSSAALDGRTLSPCFAPTAFSGRNSLTPFPFLANKPLRTLPGPAQTSPPSGPRPRGAPRPRGRCRERRSGPGGTPARNRADDRSTGTGIMPPGQPFQGTENIREKMFSTVKTTGHIELCRCSQPCLHFSVCSVRNSTTLTPPPRFVRLFLQSPSSLPFS